MEPKAKAVKMAGTDEQLTTQDVARTIDAQLRTTNMRKAEETRKVYCDYIEVAGRHGIEYSDTIDFCIGHLRAVADKLEAMQALDDVEISISTYKGGLQGFRLETENEQIAEQHEFSWVVTKKSDWPVEWHFDAPIGAEVIR
jgi:hypothetical protein